MPKLNPYLIPKLPETFIVSYYDAESDQNLTFEEWQQLHSENNPSEIRVVNEGEVYRSWKAGVDYPAYGPGFFDLFYEVECGFFEADGDRAEYLIVENERELKYVLYCLNEKLAKFANGGIKVMSRIPGTKNYERNWKQEEKIKKMLWDDAEMVKKAISDIEYQTNNPIEGCVMSYRIPYRPKKPTGCGIPVQTWKING